MRRSIRRQETIMKMTSTRLRRAIGISLAALSLVATLATSAPADAAKGGNGGGGNGPYYVCWDWEDGYGWYYFPVSSRREGTAYMETHPLAQCYRYIG